MKEYKPDSLDDQPEQKPSILHAYSENQLRAKLAGMAEEWAGKLLAKPAMLEDMLFVLLISHTITCQVAHETRRRGEPLPEAASTIESMLKEIIGAGGLTLQTVITTRQHPGA